MLSLELCKRAQILLSLKNAAKPAYLLPQIGFDTAENEPLRVWRLFCSFIHSPPYQDVVSGMVVAGIAVVSGMPPMLPMPMAVPNRPVEPRAGTGGTPR